jgi:hypothetical protein
MVNSSSPPRLERRTPEPGYGSAGYLKRRGAVAVRLGVNPVLEHRGRPQPMIRRDLEAPGRQPSSTSVQIGRVARRLIRAAAANASPDAARTASSPGISAQPLDRAIEWPGKKTRGPGAGSASSPARTRRVACCERVAPAGGPLPLVAAACAPPRAVPAPAAPYVPRRRFTTPGDNRAPSAGVPTPTTDPPAADGMFSQYWLAALTFGSEHGEPGWTEARAGDSSTNSTAVARTQSDACLMLEATGWGGC